MTRQKQVRSGWKRLENNWINASPTVSRLLAALKECIRSKDLQTGIDLHTHAIVSGLLTNVSVVNALISMYANCSRMDEARKVFDSSKRRDIVSWNSLLHGYLVDDQPQMTIHMFDAMCEQQVGNARSFVSVFSACATLGGREQDTWLNKGRLIHALAVKQGWHKEIYVGCALINMYGKCGSLTEALCVFKSMPQRDIASWNALLQGCVFNGVSELALELFNELQGDVCVPDGRTFVAALSACAALAKGSVQKGKWLEKGRDIHFQAVTSEFCDVFVKSTLIDMYAKCGHMGLAREVFDGMDEPDVISLTALLHGYVENGESQIALELYDQIKVPPDARIFCAALMACTEDGKEGLRKGSVIHSHAVTEQCCNMFVKSSLVKMYARFHDMDKARGVFDSIRYRDVVSWNALVMGYVENGENQLALDLVARMDVKRDSLTYVAALMACGNLTYVESGRATHASIHRCGLTADEVVENSLMDFYGRCGKMHIARHLFECFVNPLVVTWNSLVNGYSLQGDSRNVFKVLEEMNVAPDGVTFVSVLATCSHAGFTARGRGYLYEMQVKYGIAPGIQHYNCLIDLLARGNCLEEVLQIVREMPCEPNAVTWTAVLGGCVKWNDVIVGRVVYEFLLRTGEKDGPAHVLMENIYKGVNVTHFSNKFV